MAFILVTKQTTYLVFSAALLFFHFLVSAYRAHPSCTLFGLCTTRWSWNPFGIPLCVEWETLSCGSDQGN